MSTTAAKNGRINLRLNRSAKVIIERAASFEGKTVSSLILSSALATAENTIQAHESIQLSGQDAQRFFDALAKPATFNTRLIKALAEHDRRVDSE